MVDGVNGLDMHLLEAGEADHPLVLLLHGFPELAWSWRFVMPMLAQAGFRVVAPDQRGYGRTTGWEAGFDGDLAAFRPFNLVLDVLSLIRRLQASRVHAVIGHDFGSPVAAWCALLRPDLFERLVLMSAPFAGPPSLITDRHTAAVKPDPGSRLDQALAALTPPRKHYRSHYCTPQANDDLLHAPQGITHLLRGYYHMKSADWPGNQPHPLTGANAQALADLPRYYIMDLDASMADTVAPHTPDENSVRSCRWLPAADLAVYADEFSRTGFQGGLNWYRAVSMNITEQRVFADRQIEQPALFLSGRSDWGSYQTPGAFESMQSRALTNLHGVHLIDGAGHWLQQEQPDAVVDRLLPFLNTAGNTRNTPERDKETRQLQL